MIVVAGEALVDLIPTAAGDLGIHPGGGPFNTARWLGRLGADVAFLGAIAADPLGQRLRDQLAAAGVTLDLVVATGRPTTLALAQLDRAGAARYSFYTAGTSLPEVRPAQVEALMPADLDALYLGSIGLMLEPAASAGLRAAELARERGAMVMLDPNIRATVIADRAAYLARLDAVLAQTDVLKLSVDDLEWLAPGEPPQAAARRFLQTGPQAVLLTAGAAGATVVTADAELTVAPVAVEVADTIGAGDAFSAGFLAHRLSRGRPGSRSRPSPARGAEIVESARFAARVAAVACSVQGAAPPPDLGVLLQHD